VVQGYGSPAPITHTYTLDAQGQATRTMDGLGDATTATYDADHDVTSRTDANGHTTTDSYQYVGPNGSIGLLAQDTQPATPVFGPSRGSYAATTFNYYDATTYDLLETDRPGGGRVRYTYDGHHGLVSTAEQLTPGSFAQWRGTVTSYDAYGEPVAVTDGRGVSTDSQGNVGGSLDTQGLYTRHSAYDAQGDLSAAGTAAITTTLTGITSTATPVTTTYGYDGDGDQTRVTAANGAATTSAYDHLGRQTSTTLPPTQVVGGSPGSGPTTVDDAVQGGAVNQWYYSGAWIHCTAPPGGANCDPSYYGGTNSADNQAGDYAQIPFIGSQVTYYGTKDANRGLAALSVDGGPETLVDLYRAGGPLGNQPLYTSPPLSQGSHVLKVRVTGQKDANSGGTYVTVDRADLGTLSAATTSTAYDGDGNVAATTDATGATTTSSYDPLGRQVSSTDPVAGTSTTSYNATERVGATDADGHLSAYRYDGAGRLTQASDPLTGTVQYQYDAVGDAVGNTVAITTGDTSGTISAVETRVYDARNRVATDTVSSLSTGVPALVSVTWYDRAGNVAQVVAPAGDAALHTYDLAGELLSTEDDPGVNTGPTPALQTRYSYDLAGNQVMVTDPDGRATSTVYDGDNRVAQSVAMTGTSTVAMTLGYDPNGNTVAETTQTTDSAHPGQTQVSTHGAAYDARDQQVSETADGVATAYGYDAVGQQRTASLLGGVITRTLDAAGRVTQLDENADGTGPYSAQYTNFDAATGQAVTFQLGDGVVGLRSFDGANRPTGLTYYNVAGPSPNTARTYDAVGRVNSTTTLSGTDLLSYDGANRLVGETGPQLLAKGGAHWSYDGNGNILSATDDTGATDVYTYSTTIPNELTLMGATGDPMTKTTAYSYDNGGNVTSIANTAPPSDKNALVQHLTYDSQGRVTGVTYLDHGNGNTTTTITIAYNAQGQRSEYTFTPQGQPTLDTRFAYQDGELRQQQVISNTANGPVPVYTNTYLYGPSGEPLELIHAQPGQATGRYWYETDAQGSVVALTDANGSVVDRYAYDSWGESTSDDRTNEHVPQQLRYKAQYYDERLTWYWLGGRYYDPETERYLQPEGDQNYAYSGDNPNITICVFSEFTGYFCLKTDNPVVTSIYMFLIGEDLATLGSDEGFLPKALAVVDIVSNVTLIVPIEGEVGRAGVKGIVLELRRLVSQGAKDAAYRYRVGRALDPITRTIAHYTNRESYFYDVAKKYRINLRGIKIVFDPNLPPGRYGLTTAADGGRVIRVGMDAFESDATAANTIAHELNHARDLIRNGRFTGSEDAAYAAGNALEDYIGGGR